MANNSSLERQIGKQHIKEFLPACHHTSDGINPSMEKPLGYRHTAFSFRGFSLISDGSACKLLIPVVHVRRVPGI
jgi:hypothetical protein